MGTNQYDDLSEKISAGQPIVTVFFDQNPGNIVKLSGTKYADFYNQFTEDLGTNVPVCEGKSPKIITGGHSASGRAGFQAMMTQGINPDGFIGLDPFQIQSDTQRFPPPVIPGTTINPNLPVLAWGFERKTCGATIDIAGRGAYELSGDNNRVFFRANNGSNRKVGHCEFTDTGCGPLPGCPSVAKTSDVKDVMAKSIQVFVGSVVRGSVRTSDFQFSTANDMVPIDVFVNTEAVEPASATVPNEAYA